MEETLGGRHDSSCLENILDQSNLHYHSLDSQGRIVRVNRKWLSTLGYEKEEVMNRRFRDFLSEESCTLFNESFSAFLLDGKSKSLELFIRSKSSEDLYCDFTCIGDFDEHGKLQTTHCIFHNMSQLKKAEAELELSERNHERITELANVGIFEYNVTEAKFTYINKVLRNALPPMGDPEKIPDPSLMLTEEFRILHKQKMQDLVNGLEVPLSSEYEVMDKYKQKRNVHITNTYLRSGDSIRIIGVVHDITEHKTLANDLQDYRDRYETLLKNVPAVLFQIKVSKDSYRLFYVSENIYELIGYTPEEVLENPSLARNMIGKGEYTKIVRLVRDAHEKGRAIQLQLTIKTRSEQEKRIELILNSRDQDANTILWTGASFDVTEETSLKEQLSYSEKRYEALVNSAAPAITMMSKTGFVISVNNRLCELSGYSREEFTGKHFLSIPAFYFKDLPKYLKLYQNALKNIYPDKPVLFEYKHKNGSKRFAEAHLSSVIENGKIVSFQAMMLDVTDRIEADKREEKNKFEANKLLDFAIRLLAINKVDEIYSLLADELEQLIPGAIINIDELDKAGSILTVKELRLKDTHLLNKITRLLGKQFVGMQFNFESGTYDYSVASRLLQHHTSIYDLALHQLPKALCDQLESILGIESFYEITLGTDKEIFGGAVIFLRKGQRIEDVHFIETLFREASNTLGRIRMHRKLEKSENLYKSLAENSGEWIFRFDHNLRHIFVNQAVSKDFAKPVDLFSGKTCEEAGYSPEHSKLIELHLKDVLKKGKASQCEIEMSIKNRTEFLEWRFYPEKLDNKENTILVFARNITERKNIEGQLIDSISNKNRLYSIISHDLRSPFNSMIGFLDILYEDFDKLSDERKLQYINLLRNTSKDSYTLLDTILQWSVKGQEGEQAKPVYFDLNALIRKVLQFYQAPLHENEISVQYEAYDEVYVHADYNMIHTVMRNLLSNAIKYSGKKGRIEVKLLEKKDKVYCEVRDFGSGMSEKNMQSFTEGKALEITSGKDGAKGVGLGLRLVSEFIRYNNGEIWIEPGIGVGTSIQFTLNRKPQKTQ